MTDDKGSSHITLNTITSWPKRWLLNLINVQEKKEYHFFVIAIFAMFVALVRFTLEFMLSDRPVFQLNLNMIHMFTFYLHCIFIYTLILYLLIPNLEWRKSIHLVLIGVFLGIFPPIIDSFYYGVDNFSYGYIDNFSKNWRLFLFNPEAHVPLGEAFILYLTIFFTATVVYLKTGSFLRCVSAIPVCYAFIFLYAALIPFLAFKTQLHLELEIPVNSPLPNPGNPTFFRGFSSIFYISAYQALCCLIIYFLLNRVIFWNLLKRFNHAIPVVLTCMLGYTLFKPLDIYVFIISLALVLGSLVVIVQNDYFDKDEDAIEGRETYVDQNDVRFFNVLFLIVIALFAASASFVAYMLLLFYIVSIIYNYDFYRGKKYFPANYKVEGVWGFSSFLCGIGMVMSTAYFMSGDILSIKNIDLGGAGWSAHQLMLDEMLVSKTIVTTFLVFGGWSILSVIKDYKDIKSDIAVGNQTLYTLLLNKGKTYEGFHKKYVAFLCIMMLVPLVATQPMKIHWFFVLIHVALIATFYWSINRPPSNRVVEQSLFLVNVYLLNLVLSLHFSYQVVS